MAVIVDTNVLVGSWLTDDPLHASAGAALRKAARGAWGTLLVSDYVVDEAITLARQRSHRHSVADGLAAYLLGEPPHTRSFALARVGEEEFHLARAIFHEHPDRLLSFTDCTIIALVQRMRLQGVLSFDRGFDGIVPRIDPVDART